VSCGGAGRNGLVGLPVLTVESGVLLSRYADLRLTTGKVTEVARLLEQHPRASMGKIAKKAGVSGEFVKIVARSLGVGLPVAKVAQQLLDTGFTATAYGASPTTTSRPSTAKPKQRRTPPVRLPEGELIPTAVGRLVRYRVPRDNVILVEKRDAFTIVSWTARCSARDFVRACRGLPGIDQEPTTGILAIRGAGHTTGTAPEIFQAVAGIPPKTLGFTCDFVRFDTRSYGTAFQNMRLGALSSEKQRVVSFVSRGSPRAPLAPLARSTAPARLARLVLLARDSASDN